VHAKGKAPKAATWARVEEALRHSRNYWIATTRPDGRPHAAPVWGVWLSGVLYFGSDRASRKGKNIAHQPYVVAHLESGDDVVILEGTAREVKDKRSLSRMDAAYAEKYGGVKPSEMGGALVYAVRPEVAFTWEEADFVGSAVRWKF
jgi:nitroimidazol reductase NimA-like FMN-containing flavoprotein (pyridoxamine 5'-phosphate oxidase superfamily)